MNLLHVGLVSRDAARAERFYGELLGLEKKRSGHLDAQLATQLFGVDEDCEIIYYGSQELLIEVFLTGWSESIPGRISHVCLEVADRDELLARCHKLGFKVRQAPKGEGVVSFIQDDDGNLFELKEKQQGT